ncbi:hypothetical protein GFS60_05310 [Rhodococcus sp. WAY2]|jgi:hypothetical protein|nr:hypothetical protein GFS60_05310 [Rhodococcus sp. WAY2]
MNPLTANDPGCQSAPGRTASISTVVELVDQPKVGRPVPDSRVASDRGTCM